MSAAVSFWVFGYCDHDRLARGLAGVINLLDPDAVVLGGGISNLPDLPRPSPAPSPAGHVRVTPAEQDAGSRNGADHASHLFHPRSQRRSRPRRRAPLVSPGQRAGALRWHPPGRVRVRPRPR
ncbi:MAG: ROK family protein [Gemmatimonadales bacterium]|nr:ROK family protein [Gemmatimonadales bacterium]